MNEQIRLFSGSPIPFGVTRMENGYNFSIPVLKAEKAELKLYEPHKDEPFLSVDLTGYPKTGSVYSVRIQGLPKNFEYQFTADGEGVKDPYGKVAAGPCRYGIPAEDFDWDGDISPNVPMNELVLYKLHVKGFTVHNSSRVLRKGTFLGIIGKIPYLQELGINGVELMPVVEFDGGSNYWGYGEAQYFAPKADYASGDDPQTEFKHLVKALHQAGIEVILEFSFMKPHLMTEMADCLRYWAMEYHVDGFHFNDNALLPSIPAKDPLLTQVKLLCAGYGKDEGGAGRLASYHDGFMQDMRRFLKSDEDMINTVIRHFTDVPAGVGSIHYIANNNGFTLMDLVSYNFKHNEANGEDNHDGSDLNYSWNCGVEGKTRRKKILSLRKQQIKNALSFVLLAPGTPLIYSGDEFGNSQDGNNNAYCQDNEISWLNWNLLKTNRDIFEYTKALIQLRKDNPIFCWEKPYRMMDYLACGYPDVSVHGTKPWYPSYTRESRTFGIMYCGRYDPGERGEAFLYIAFNMYWEPEEFSLPALPSGYFWERILCTSETGYEDMILDGRSIAVYAGRKAI